jgi:nicotinamidase-related amidase
MAAAAGQREAKGSIDVAKARRIVPDRSCGIVVDVQGYFLSQVDKPLRTRLVEDIGALLRLFDRLGIPVVVTLEQPVDQKGTLPPAIGKHAGRLAKTFEKNFFDLSKEAPIRRHLAGLKRKQVIVAGCETDVCVLQSCLGLLDLGYEVFVVEDLLFSSAAAVDSALARMRDAGAVMLTHKTLLYELLASVDGCDGIEGVID